MYTETMTPNITNKYCSRRKYLKFCQIFQPIMNQNTLILQESGQSLCWVDGLKVLHHLPKSMYVEVLTSLVR